ncbi:MAG: hypothetical protein WBA72_03060 [Ornithinimicrobium sp.]
MVFRRSLTACCAALILAGCAGTDTPSSDSAQPSSAAPTPEAVELPRGGTEFFPRYRLFGYSGAPLSEGLGRLGIGDLDERVVEMEERGAEYAGSREVMPVLELIATVVHPVPGDDGMYRDHAEDEVVQDYLDAARRHDAILLINIQPGRADFIDELEYWEDFLVEPDVGVALDPEWAVEEGQTPGRVYGQTTGAELDESAAYLADLVEQHDLPEKVMVYHQVHQGVVREESDLQPHDGVAIIKSVDGIGAARDKVDTYNRVNENTPPGVIAGFKLFYEEDAEFGPIMTGPEVLELSPVPQYVLFE